MTWTQTSATHWDGEGGVSVRLMLLQEYQGRETWLTYVGEKVVCRDGGYCNAADAMRAAPCIKAVQVATGNVHLPSHPRKPMANLTPAQAYHTEPIAGSGPPKPMPERRVDGFRTEIARIRTALDRLEVLAADHHNDQGETR